MCIKVTGQLTVYFDKPFWVGVFESIEGEMLRTCRVVFGPEPKDYEIYEMILNQYEHLRFGKSMNLGEQGRSVRKINPKRMQRMAKKQTEQSGVSTKAQEAMKKAYEASKQGKKQQKKSDKEAERHLRYQQKQAKKKLKKRGH